MNHNSEALLSCFSSLSLAFMLVMSSLSAKLAFFGTAFLSYLPCQPHEELSAVSRLACCSLLQQLALPEQFC